MLTQGFQKFYGSITKAPEAPETTFQQNVEDLDKFTPILLNTLQFIYTHHHFAKYTPVFVFLTGFFPKHLETLWITQWYSFWLLEGCGSLRIVQHCLFWFLECCETLRITQRWVLNISMWSSQGRMPTNNGPRTKLGYDKYRVKHVLICEIHVNLWWWIMTLWVLDKWSQIS